MSLFQLSDPFLIIPGDAPIVVGAPHHGSRPNVDADLHTGPIAQALATHLDGRAVVVSDMRRIVDANKNPLRQSRSVRHHSIRYQNELFCNFPRVVIEIHGHISGKYDLEVTTGFDLDPAVPGDALFMNRLSILKEVLPAAIASRIGQKPSVGIYPLDRDVQKAATNTYTFQKIRRARNLAGLEWYGLHFELSSQLRTGKPAQAKGYIDALAGAMASAIQEAFGPLLQNGPVIPRRVVRGSDDCDTKNGQTFRVVPAPDRFAMQNVVVLHPGDLETLGALNGDSVNLCNGSEEIQTIITASQTVRPGYAGLPARLRGQIGLEKRGQVQINLQYSLPVQDYRASSSLRPSNSFQVVGVSRYGNGHSLWMTPEEVIRLGLQEEQPLQIQGQPGTPLAAQVILHSDADLPTRFVAASSGLMERLTLTLGEVIKIEAAIENGSIGS